MVYTKKGDGGTTSLVGGARVSKCHPRVEAYGTVDELNSHIGLLAEMILQKINSGEIQSTEAEQFATLHSQLKTIQNNLFVIQSLLASENDDIRSRMPQISSSDTEELEHWIDNMEKLLPPMKGFVIAGGSMMSAQAHVCRTVCRRAERCIVFLDEKEPVDDVVKKNINRLSDYLFVISRFINKLDNKDEIFWTAR